MAAFGYFGKIPAMPDFVFHGLSMRMTDAWAVHVASWLATARKTARTGWSQRFLSSPVWRFVIARDVLGPECWVGLLASSLDSVGREFPFIVMISADFDTAEERPLQMLDARLDEVEDKALSFMEGQVAQTELVQALGSAASAIARDLAASAIGNGRLAPHEDHDAICISFPPGELWGERYEAAYSWPAAKDNKHRSRLCLWWHEGSDDRLADYCVTRGMPPRAGGAAFFLGDWEEQGWTRQDPAAYPDNR
jgi:type VI secretion system protein ImpM